MASDVVRNLADNIMGTNSPEQEETRSASRDALRRPPDLQSREQLHESSSYVWATEDSVFSREVDRWIGGDRASPINTAVQPSRVMAAQRLTQSEASSLDSTGFWYMAAMVLPLFNLVSARNWRCTPSSILNTAELLLTHIAGYCGRARSRLRRMTREQASRDIFAGAMDVILVIYALGFLLISMYQATVFQSF